MARELFCVRHGETLWSLLGRHTGKTDLPLTEDGKAQSICLKEELAKYAFDAIFVSPLQRAKSTASLAGFNDKGVIDPDLVEWDYGEYEGKTSSEIHKLNPTWRLFVDGAPQGETVQDVMHRADRLIDKVRSLDGRVLIFSSGHITRMIMTRWLHVESKYGELFSLEPASLTVLGHEHDLPVLISRAPIIL